MSAREKMWRRTYASAMDVYGSIDGYDDHDARLTADAAARGWYSGSWGSFRKRNYRPVAKMPAPGNLLNLGQFLQLEYAQPDGEIRGIAFDAADNVPLWWSDKLQACFVLPGMKQGPCNLPPRKTENRLAKVWAKGRPASCSAVVSPPRPPLRALYPSIQVSYRSDKFSHGQPMLYIHHFGPDVISHFSHEPHRSTRAPVAIMIRGGRLSLTTHGIDG